MSKKDKLIEKLKSKPKDFTFDELTKLLFSFNYKLDNTGRTSGSAVRFINSKTNHVIRIHKPHPEPTLKYYIVKLVLEELRKVGAINE